MRARLVVSLIGFAILGVACGRDAPSIVRPADVPDGLVPPTVQGGELAFYESKVPGVEEAFRNPRREALSADGQLWELRRGDRLVGALQLTTVVPAVDLRERHRRESIIRQIMPSTVDRITVEDVSVWTNSSNDKTVFLWFGRDMFVVLTLKGSEDDLDPEGILNEMVTFSTLSDKWKPLYIDEEEEE